MKVIDRISGMKDKFVENQALVSIFKEYLYWNFLIVKIEFYNILENLKDENFCFTQEKGIVIDLTKPDESIKKSAKRVYSVRNSVVHHKSSELMSTPKNIYNLKKDFTKLQVEVILVKIMAEQIIINTSQLI